LLPKASAGGRWKENDLIFLSSIGTPEDPSNLREDFRHNLDKACLPKIRFHDLRHTAASIMLNRGVPIIVVSRRLGHSGSIVLEARSDTKMQQKMSGDPK
jgi:integrase